MTTAEAIFDALHSKVLATGYGEPANLIDVIASLASHVGNVAGAITTHGKPTGGVVCLTGAVIDVAGGLEKIADAIDNLASAVREAKR